MEWLLQQLPQVGDSPLLQGVLIAVSTFVLEDGATIASGLLVSTGDLAFKLAFVALTAGIVIGDMGLYVIGRVLGERCIKWRLISEDTLTGPSQWMRDNLFGTVLVSRFVPGSRTPTYLAAGVLKVPFVRFGFYSLIAVMPWVLVVLFLTMHLGKAVMPLLGDMRWPIAVFALGLFVAGQYFFVKKRRKLRAQSGPPVVSFFEFWPPWLFYAPVVAYCAGLSIKHRSITLPSCANPSIYSGGWVRESKSQILGLVSRAFERFMLRFTTFSIDGGPAGEERVDAAINAARTAGITFPFVAKPDVGQRGAGVQLLRNAADLSRYLDTFPRAVPIVFQELADYSHEVGVFYVRRPGEESGRIFSITLKEFPRVTGDGRRTLRELIEADPRARLVKHIYFKRHAARLDTVIPAGEDFRLVFAGNHCQGTIFRDGAHLRTPELERRIDEVARSMQGFYFGRFDLRFNDEAELKHGEGFKIIEVNGASAEATHIWDARMRLRDAYRVLFEQFRLLYEIGAENRRRGARPMSLAQIVRDTRAYFRTARLYPPTA